MKRVACLEGLTGKQPERLPDPTCGGFRLNGTPSGQSEQAIDLLSAANDNIPDEQWAWELSLQRENGNDELD